MATKPLEQKRGKVNIEAANSVMANPSGIQDTQPRQNIASWVAEEQPRARLSRYGAAQMSRRLLHEFGGIEELLAAPLERLLDARGVGLAKASQIKAIQELGTRLTEAELVKAQRFEDPTAVSQYLRKRLGHLPHEAFACLFLNAKHQQLSFEILFHGSIDRTHVHAREILRRGLEVNAAAVIVCHNHPSGNAEPSQADIALTRSLADLLAQVEIRLLDHMVVSARSWVSLQMRGLI
jgi:DNA repair protein RadC